MNYEICERCKVALQPQELKDIYQCPVCKVFYDKKTN